MEPPAVSRFLYGEYYSEEKANVKVYSWKKVIAIDAVVCPV